MSITVGVSGVRRNAAVALCRDRRIVAACEVVRGVPRGPENHVLARRIYPTIGAGLHFVIKPKERMNLNLEYAQGSAGSRGVYLKLGYAW